MGLARLTDRLEANPFLVLDVTEAAAPMEVERRALALIAMMELGLDEARTYSTPAGKRERSPERVREAAAALRDPTRRLRYELELKLSLRVETMLAARRGSDGTGWLRPTAAADLGWTARCPAS